MGNAYTRACQKDTFTDAKTFEKMRKNKGIIAEKPLRRNSSHLETEGLDQSKNLFGLSKNDL